jgi:hypothetical protein
MSREEAANGTMGSTSRGMNVNAMLVRRLEACQLPRERCVISLAEAASRD